ncbi:ParA family protein [Modicisalibacter tunisiensis]|uniref:ParA family protein n=1 Tax=Modicisalibacter tunisiensis TaxID=390637 RepID=A0ABS7X092_9GAMM|nr:ParA family protein [Modicisalibacter tunisiensis]KXS36799.1 MAG: cobyrinic acid a,c-diamide synthase [Halomonadaceae bacterium T82-2]MBZ9567819.1 ParA family protein [Modicisalibacter tunisiensis]
MKMLALYSIKGGVGKTASAVNLAAEACRDGRRVLLWDLDPQAATTFYLRAKPKVRGGVGKLVKGKAALDKVIRNTGVEGLDLLPAAIGSRAMEQLLEDRKPSRLRRMLQPVHDDYDLIILDCPPSLSTLAEQIVSSVDALLVPVIPTTLSQRTLDQLRHYLDDANQDCPVWPFVTLADRRRKLHREIVDDLGEHWPTRLSTTIPNASAIERMGLERAPVNAFAPRCAGSRAYAALWREIAQRLG